MSDIFLPFVFFLKKKNIWKTSLWHIQKDLASSLQVELLQPTPLSAQPSRDPFPLMCTGSYCQTMEVGVNEGVDNHCERLMWMDLKQEEIAMEPSLVEEVNSRGQNCLLVKLLSQKYFNREAFKGKMKKVWKPVKPLCFCEMGMGMMLAEFEEPNDKTRVIRDGPWSFDKSLILVKEFESRHQVRNIRMESARGCQDPSVWYPDNGS